MGDIIIFKLIDRREIQASKHENDQYKKLDFPVWHGIKNPYFVQKKGGLRENIRYIKGSSTLKVDEQKKNGETFNISTDLVGFDSGNDILIDIERDALLVEFLRNHPNNVLSKNHNPDVNDKIFTEFIPEEYNRALVADVELQDAAMDELRAMRNLPERLKGVAVIFGINIHLDVQEVYLELRKIVLDNPKEFLDSVANRENDVKAVIQKALQYSILSRTPKGYTIQGGGVVVKTKEGLEEKNQEALYDFLLSEQGKEVYKQILIKIGQHEIELKS